MSCIFITMQNKTLFQNDQHIFEFIQHIFLDEQQLPLSGVNLYLHLIILMKNIMTLGIPLLRYRNFIEYEAQLGNTCSLASTCGTFRGCAGQSVPLMRKNIVRWLNNHVWTNIVWWLHMSGWILCDGCTCLDEYCLMHVDTWTMAVHVLMMAAHIYTMDSHIRMMAADVWMIAAHVWMIFCTCLADYCVMAAHVW